MTTILNMCGTVRSVLVVLVISGLGCGEGSALQDLQLPALQLKGWSHPIVLDGSTITLEGSGFLPEPLVVYNLRLDGPGVALGIQPVQRLDDTHLEFSVGAEFLNAVPAGSPIFNGTVTLSRILLETHQQDSVSLPVQFRVLENMEPLITSFSSEGNVLYPGDEIHVEGNGFLLKGEGHTVIQLKGSFKTKVPPETKPLQAIIPVNGEDRDNIRFTLTPDILGIRPGTFVGAIEVTNQSKTGQLPGIGIPGIVRDLKAPRIDFVSPPIASRGQRIVLEGRGFVSTDPFYESTTLIRLEGTFDVAKTSNTLVLDGPSALALFPDGFKSNRVMEYILRVSPTPSGNLTGLGLTAGTFTGTITPMLVSGPETVIGDGIQTSLTIAPQRQVVFVNFLPGFSTTVAEMGLGFVEQAIKDRVLAVCARDYSGINIEFRADRPTDFAEYSVVEVGGADPNNAGLFGLDNTKGKDVGNLRFNDVIGGTNAETREQGYFAFGGVFVRSFFQLSPSIPGVDPLPIASPRFDDIFGIFMPLLNGTPVYPNDPRQGFINEAVRVLGNLVGTTVTHEIGHSLGLSNIDGEFHNIGDNPGWIMDAGTFRPFAERAEIDGWGAGFFSNNNRSYLEYILPIN